MAPLNDKEATSDDVSLRRKAVNDEENAKNEVSTSAETLHRKVLSGDENTKSEATQVAASADASSSTTLAQDGITDAKSEATQASTTVDAPSGTTLAEEGNRKTQGVASTEVNAEPTDPPNEDDWFDVRTPILEAKAEAQPWTDVRTPLNLEAKDGTVDDSNWANVRTPLNLEAKDDTVDGSNWANVRTPLNLEATDSAASLAVSDDDAAQPWRNVRNTLTLEAKEAKQLVVGAGRQLEALVGNDQLHLLIGGSLLLVAGVVMSFVRRARKQKAAEKALEDETYLLMA